MEFPQNANFAVNHENLFTMQCSAVFDLIPLHIKQQSTLLSAVFVIETMVSEYLMSDVK